MADPVATVRRLIGAVNDRTLRDQAAEIVHPSFVRHDLVQLFPDSQGAAGAADFLAMVLAAMPDFRFDVEEVFGAGELVTARLRMSGTHTGADLLGRPASGRRLEAPAIFVYRVVDDRVAEAWQMVDGLAFFRLAGLLPHAGDG